MTWTATMVEQRIKDAARTLRRLPDKKVTGYFNLWPAYKHDPLDLLQQEAVYRPGPPMPEEIDEMEQVLFVWLLKWLETDERKLLWLRAERVRWKMICSQFGCDRTTAWRRYNAALGKVAERLNTR